MRLHHPTTKISRSFPRLPQTVGLLGPWRIKLRASNSLFRFRLEAIADLTTKLRA